jgi:hypothetical protein
LNKEFYYHSYRDGHSINVYLKQLNYLGLPVWSKKGDQGRGWKRGEIRIKNMQNKYNIVFEAFFESGYLYRVFIF